MMSRRRNIGRVLHLAALSALALLLRADAQAQCALCKTALSAAGETTARTMNLGIIVLLVPPVAIFCSIFVLAVKQRKGGGGFEGD